MARTTRNGPEPGNPPGLIALGFAGVAAQALVSGLRLGLIEELAQKPATARQLARKAGGTERGIRILLDALVALGQLAKRDTKYCLSPGTEMLLAVPGTDVKTYCADGLMHATAQLRDFAELTDVVLTGTPVSNVADPAAGERFFVGLARSLFVHNYPSAQGLFRQTRAEFGRGPLEILDVAAGGAPWSMPFAQSNKRARVTAVDFPAVLEVARHYSRAVGVEGQYELLPGDIRRVPFGQARFDLAILGHICHSEGPKHSLRLFRKVAKALKPKGVMIVLDFVADDQRSGQGPAAFPLIFALNMLVHTAEGNTFTFRQFRDWGTQVGFRRMDVVEIPAASPALLFRK